MALADYRLCDVCSGKVFYDSNLNYDFEKCNERGEPALDYLGDWAVICTDCAKTHECKIAARATPASGQADTAARRASKQAAMDSGDCKAASVTHLCESCCDLNTSCRFASGQAAQSQAVDSPAAEKASGLSEDPRITALYKLRDIAERDMDHESASIISAAIADLPRPAAADAGGLSDDDVVTIKRVQLAELYEAANQFQVYTARPTAADGSK